MRSTCCETDMIRECFSPDQVQQTAVPQLPGPQRDHPGGGGPQVTCHVSRVMILSRVTRSDAAAPGADTRLVMFEGSSAGKKMVSFTTGGDLLMGRNIIRRWTTDKLYNYIYLYSKSGFVYCHFEARLRSRIKYHLTISLSFLVSIPVTFISNCWCWLKQSSVDWNHHFIMQLMAVRTRRMVRQMMNNKMDQERKIIAILPKFQ